MKDWELIELCLPKSAKKFDWPRITLSYIHKRLSNNDMPGAIDLIAQVTGLSKRKCMHIGKRLAGNLAAKILSGS